MGIKFFLAVGATQKQRIHRHPYADREGYRETKTTEISGMSWEDDPGNIDHRGLITVRQ